MTETSKHSIDLDQFAARPISSRDIDCWKMMAHDAIPFIRWGDINWPMIVLSLCAHIESAAASDGCAPNIKETDNMQSECKTTARRRDLKTVGDLQAALADVHPDTPLGLCVNTCAHYVWNSHPSGEGVQVSVSDLNVAGGGRYRLLLIHNQTGWPSDGYTPKWVE